MNSLPKNLSRGLKWLLILVVGFLGGAFGTMVTNSLSQQPTAGSKAVSTSYKNTTDTSQAVEKVKKAVVSVITYTKEDSQLNGDNLFSEASEEGENSNIYGEGSGVIYKKDKKYAYAITNTHVISGGKAYDLQLSDGSKVPAELVGSDVFSDISVVRIPADKAPDVAELGDSSNLTIGETAIAIGSPLGSQYANSVTQGIISSLDRTVSLTTEDGQAVSTTAIQTDAAINPGNSGGPLINIQGQVIGINSSKISSSRQTSSNVAVEGMGFAIPINQAKSIADQLEENGSVSRPALGIQMTNLASLSSYDLAKLKLPSSIRGGVLVRSVQSGMPASGRLQENDIIIGIDKEVIYATSFLQKALYEHEMGDEIKVTFLRDGQEKTTTIKLTKSTQDLKK